jgi:hypothetical protein
VRYQRDFFRICEALRSEGRAEAVSKIAAKHTSLDKTCVACRPFFMMFSASCKAREAKLWKKKVKATPTPLVSPTAEAADQETSEQESQDAAAAEEDSEATPLPSPSPTVKVIKPQREMSATVFQEVSSLFTALAADQYINIETCKAVKRLKVYLEQEPSATAAEKEYFAALAALVYAPFEALEARAFEITPAQSNQGDLDRFFER